MTQGHRAEEAAVTLQADGGVAVLTLNQPSRRNAIDPSMRLAPDAALRSIRRDQTVRAVVQTGAGGSFCAGGDIGSMRDREQG